jgi:hypothetical protein
MRVWIQLFLIILISCTLPHLSTSYTISTTLNQIDDVSAALAKQDIEDFHRIAPNLLNILLSQSGQLDTDTMVALIAARLAYISSTTNTSASKNSSLINPPPSKLKPHSPPTFKRNPLLQQKKHSSAQQPCLCHIQQDHTD